MTLFGKSGTLCAAVLAAASVGYVAAQLPRTSLNLPAGLTTAAHAAEAIVAKRWETYINTRYGAIVEYPADLFTKGAAPPDNAGCSFEAKAVQARFHVYSHANALEQSREELEAEDADDLGDPGAKKQNGEDWYQIIAVKGNETIVRRVLLNRDATMVYRLEIAFPSRSAAAFAPIVERMTKSFRVDPTIPEAAGRAS